MPYRVRSRVPAGFDPSDVPLYEDQQARDDAYYEAEAESTPFFAVERYEEGYAITYDLLPAGYELSEPMRKELNERVTRTVEDVVGDEALATVEVSRSIGASLGNVSFFQREATARDVAAVISRLVLAEENWVEADGPGDLPPTEVQKN
ncbi:hypothetical protein Hmuk_0375 [Halomicrobium mukohataei DSM 12286]|uniref:Uncharacterized protein n=1 Tax=Halomicrobium mukohataei (strain ATCC 700874 / DSM 12286 / JCM 9738 / NCIMB 13541) TaxID=485914 RepID=C7NXS4_HALMD|nr:hypothetical protein Hmuk_0375 [Halomicrobium mukohataei DSM 12286]